MNLISRNHFFLNHKNNKLINNKKNRTFKYYIFDGKKIKKKS